MAALPLLLHIMAGSFLSTLPIVIVFLAMQKQFVSGLTVGALKG